LPEESTVHSIESGCSSEIGDEAFDLGERSLDLEIHPHTPVNPNRSALTRPNTQHTPQGRGRRGKLQPRGALHHHSTGRAPAAAEQQPTSDSP